MLWANVGIVIVVLILASIYFLPYRRLKGKVFKKLLPDPAGITAMEYKTSAYSLQLEKRNGVWYVIDSDWEADKSKVTRLLNRLRDLNVDERVTGSQDDPEFNIGSNGYLILDYSGKITTIIPGIMRRRNNLRLGAEYRNNSSAIKICKVKMQLPHSYVMAGDLPAYSHAAPA